MIEEETWKTFQKNCIDEDKSYSEKVEELINKENNKKR